MFLSNLASAVLDGVELSRNAGGVAGGGARLADLATMSAIDLLVQGNTADQGAGLHLSGMGVGETAYSRFLGNIATNAGGGILAQNPGAQHPMHHLQFAENQATEGAGLYLFNDTSTQHPITFSDFVANDGPAVSLRQSPGALVSHTSAAHNSGDGFEADTASAATARIEWNCSWDNATEFGGALSSLVGTDGNISADPDYATVNRDGDPTNDRLIPGSRSGLRDMGDTSLSDLDGTRADLGHLGGPDARDQDQDGDGSAISDGDCDDAEPTTLPGAAEVWYDGEDSDCLGGDDFDADLDGYPIPDDCDDQDAAVNPAAIDDTTDGVDQDCDGKDGPEDGTGSSTSDASPDGQDLDGDGFTEADDCDDADSRAYPGNTETCGDRVDNDCDGYIDDFDSECVGKASARACSALAASGALPGAALALLVVAARRR